MMILISSRDSSPTSAQKRRRVGSSKQNRQGLRKPTAQNSVLTSLGSIASPLKLVAPTNGLSGGILYWLELAGCGFGDRLAGDWSTSIRRIAEKKSRVIHLGFSPASSENPSSPRET